MSESTLFTVALEMLRTTNVYTKEVEALVYEQRYSEKSLIELVKSKLGKSRGGYRNNSIHNLTIAYNAIAESMVEYWEDYPVSFSFKQRMKEKFTEWLVRIKEKYMLNDLDIPEELEVHSDELDTAIVMVKELHSRKGVTKEDLNKKLGFNHLRSIQKNLRKLSPGLYEGDDIEKGNVYTPFRLGGQPIFVDIKAFEIKGDSKKYYTTQNTIHPIVLQENLMQVGTLLQALGRNYYEYESDISTTIAIDIWSQLSDYAKRRLESYYAAVDEDFSDFIEMLKDECPDNHACGFRTERQMVGDVEMGLDDSLMYLMKASGRTCTIVYEDDFGAENCLKNQKVKLVNDSPLERVYLFISVDGEVQSVEYSHIIDIIIE